MTGLAQRDRRVLQCCRDQAVPIALAMASGCAENIDDTVAIHTNTIFTAQDIFSRA
jgi:hypothetical protein